MQIPKPEEKHTRNQPSQNQNLTTDRDISSVDKPPNELSGEAPGRHKKNWKCILILSIIGILIVAGVIVIIIVCLKKNKDDKVPKTKLPNEELLPELNLEEVKDVFSPSFKISSKEKTLTQLSQKSFQNYESLTNGIKSSYTILNKAIYDIFTINSTIPSDLEKNFYSKIYTTIITVNSLCSKVSSDPENDDCKLEKNLDLNRRNTSNLRRNADVDENLIRRAILPICIVEHTDTNIIISANCPETLSENYKADILRAFSNIKPDSIKGFELGKAYSDTKKEEKDDKIIISYFDYVCPSPNYDPTKSIVCNVSKSIITDKEGDLISTKIINSSKAINDEKNLYSNTFTYEFKNIPKEASDSFNEEIYQQNLESILSITKPLMNKEIFIKNFTNYVIDLMSGAEVTNTDTNLRDLSEQVSEKIPGVHEENIFNKTILNISMNLNLKNDIGLSESQTAKAISYNYVNNEEYNELSINKIRTNLNETLNKFISLSKSGNKLANKLFEDLNEPLSNFMDIIKTNIEKINNCLANKPISEIFDSTFVINELNSLPFDFIFATENLYNAMNNLAENILYTIDGAKKKLK